LTSITMNDEGRRTRKLRRLGTKKMAREGGRGGKGREGEGVREAM
jgi:hypothetical protein